MTLATSLGLSLLLGAPQAAPVEFRRQFTKGETAQYQVHSQLNTEFRQTDLDTWIPQDLDLIYKFNYTVTAMMADGICVMKYLRPNMVQIDGETADSPPVTKTEKVNYDFELTVSPINEVLNMKDLTKKPAPKSGGGLKLMRPAGAPQVNAFISQFTGEIYRLALFVGALDSSMDFAPPLPVVEVAVGETWKKTVGFSPQKLKGKDNKLAVQRMDFTYTYKGIVNDTKGKKVHRIEGDLALKTDLAEFIHQLFDVKSNVTGLKEIPMHMTAKVLYDLDLKTHQTLRATATSTGGFGVFATSQPNKAAHEEKFKSRVTLSLLSSKR